MRIEILVENDEPLIFPLKSSKVSLGSSESCDITIVAEGVSRKHLTFITEGDQYFVVDQGSTNGSYVNEKRLVPGKRVEFTSFFPVRLGHNVLISLLSDDEGEISEIQFPETFSQSNEAPSEEKITEKIKEKKAFRTNPEETTTISLAELKKTSTENLVQKRNQRRERGEKKKKGKKRSLKDINFTKYLILSGILAAAIYNIKVLQGPVEEAEFFEVGQVVKLEDVPEGVQEAKEETRPNLLVPEIELVNKEKYETLLYDLKCTTDVEKYLCDFFPGAKDNLFGVVQVGLTLHVLIDGGRFFREARELLVGKDKNKTVDEDFVSDTGIYLYLLGLKKNLKTEDFQGMNFSFGFYEKQGENFKVRRVLAIKPSAFSRLSDAVKAENLRFVKVNGPAALSNTKTLYQTF